MFSCTCVCVYLRLLLLQLDIQHNCLVSYVYNHMVTNSPGYFISASIDVSPASHIGTLGLSVACFCLIFTVIVRHKLMKRLLVGRATLLHRFSLLLALLSLFSVLGVGAYQHHQLPFGHNLFAVLFFIPSMIHVGIDNYLEWRYKLYAYWARRLRLILVTFICVSVVIFLTLLRASGDMDAPNRDMNLLFIAAIAELSAFAFLLFYFLSLFPNFSKTRLYIVLVERQAARILEAFRVDAFLTTDRRLLATGHVSLPSRNLPRLRFNVLTQGVGNIVPRLRRVLMMRMRKKPQG
eukprot:m.68269 g.68269  ORF g.68269 m.68269 type:complete len:293 (+) comp13675_c0_seq3:928-1806(+)